MNKKTYSQIFDAAARNHVPDGIDLSSRIIKQIQKKKSVSIQPRVKVLMAVLAAVIVFGTVLIIGPTVAKALRQLFGYIPGLGLVTPGSSLRMLAAPVRVEREGLTVTVEKGIIDSQRTILQVKFEGFDFAKYSLNCLYTPAAERPHLHLADGSTLELTEADNDRMVFLAIPAANNDVTLELPCLLLNAPKNWVIPLHFVPADDKDMTLVIEIPPTIPTLLHGASSQPQVTVSAPAPTESPYGISLVLDKVVPLEDGYILMGNMHWPAPNSGNSPTINPSLIARIVDTNGKELEWEFADTDASPGTSSFPWAYKILGKQQAWPLTLTMDAKVTLPATPEVSFTFDSGSNPQPGQTWAVNQDVTVNGHLIHILSATLDNQDPQKLLLDFNLQSDPDIEGAELMDKDYHPLSGGMYGGGGGGASAPGYFSAGLGYDAALPPGPHTLTFTNITATVDGNWHVTWQP